MSCCTSKRTSWSLHASRPPLGADTEAASLILTYTGGHADFALKRRGSRFTSIDITESSFPESGDVLLHIEPDHSHPLRACVCACPPGLRASTVDLSGAH